jgi:hypothetical protein
MVEFTVGIIMTEQQRSDLARAASKTFPKKSKEEAFCAPPVSMGCSLAAFFRSLLFRGVVLCAVVSGDCLAPFLRHLPLSNGPFVFRGAHFAIFLVPSRTRCKGSAPNVVGRRAPSPFKRQSAMELWKQHKVIPMSYRDKAVP